MGIRNALAYTGDSLSRTAAIHRILDPSAGPLIAVRLNILTRKTLGGLQTDLSGRVLDASGAAVPGLYAAGEVAGFGGGGGCTDTAPWKGRSSAAACSPDGRQDARRPRRSEPYGQPGTDLPKRATALRPAATWCSSGSSPSPLVRLPGTPITVRRTGSRMSSALHGVADTVRHATQV
jgi:hypothetical protein